MRNIRTWLSATHSTGPGLVFGLVVACLYGWTYIIVTWVTR